MRPLVVQATRATTWMRCKRDAFATVLLMLAAGTTPALEPLPRAALISLEKADAAFRAGVEKKAVVLAARKHFAEATDHYLDVHRRGIRSPSLYLKLGNAAALADRWPEALWAYHMGLKLDPNNARLRTHLTFVRAKVIYPPANFGRPDADTWPVWLHRPSVGELLLIGALAYLLTYILAAIAWLRGAVKLIVVALVCLSVAGSAGFAYWRSNEQATVDRDTPLVIIVYNTPFQRGNGTSYPQHAILPLLPRGMEVRRLHVRGHWLQVRLSTGEVGWIPTSAALVVEP